MAMTTSYCPRAAARKSVSAGCGPLTERPSAFASATPRSMARSSSPNRPPSPPCGVTAATAMRGARPCSFGSPRGGRRGGGGAEHARRDVQRAESLEDDLRTDAGRIAERDGQGTHTRIVFADEWGEERLKGWKGRLPPSSTFQPSNVSALQLCLSAQFILFEQVLDAVLLDEEVGCAFAVHLQAVPVVPLDPAADLLAVGHDDDHRRAGVHLLDVVEALGVRDLGGSRAGRPRAVGRGAFEFRERGT